MAADHHFEQAFFARQNPSEVDSNVFAALNSWSLGYPQRARTQMCHALIMRHNQSQPYLLASVYGNLARLNYFMGAYGRIRAWAQKTIIVCEALEFPFWLTIGKLYAGRALAEKGHLEQGITEMKAALAHHKAQGHKGYRTHYICMLAELYLQAECLQEALATIDEALALADETGERFWLPEMVRLRGDILLAQTGAAEDAIAQYEQAIAIAQEQQSKSLELRATVSLCRLWQQQGRGAEAHGALKEIYNWFTEGFRTPDLREARQLLEKLS